MRLCYLDHSQVISTVDVLYVTRIQKERFSSLVRLDNIGLYWMIGRFVYVVSI